MIKNFQTYTPLNKIFVKIDTNRKRILIILLPCVVAFFLYTALISKLTLGTVFFGGIPALYNVRLAQFFFQQSLRFDTIDTIPPSYAHYQMGRTYFIQGKLERAESEILAELAYYPENSKSYYMLGLIEGFQGKTVEAIESFKTYVSYNEDSWAGRNDLAWLLFQAGRIDEALSYIEPIVAKNRRNPWILNTYGTLLMNQGRLEEAKRILSEGYDISLAITNTAWGKSYPGNDPRVYPLGLNGMRESFKNNLEIVNKRLHVDK